MNNKWPKNQLDLVNVWKAVDNQWVFERLALVINDKGVVRNAVFQDDGLTEEFFYMNELERGAPLNEGLSLVEGTKVVTSFFGKEEFQKMLPNKETKAGLIYTDKSDVERVLNQIKMVALSQNDAKFFNLGKNNVESFDAAGIVVFSDDNIDIYYPSDEKRR